MEGSGYEQYAHSDAQSAYGIGTPHDESTLEHQQHLQQQQQQHDYEALVHHYQAQQESIRRQEELYQHLYHQYLQSQGTGGESTPPLGASTDIVGETGGFPSSIHQMHSAGYYGHEYPSYNHGAAYSAAAAIDPAYSAADAAYHAYLQAQHEHQQYMATSYAAANGTAPPSFPRETQWHQHHQHPHQSRAEAALQPPLPRSAYDTETTADVYNADMYGSGEAFENGHHHAAPLPSASTHTDSARSSSSSNMPGDRKPTVSQLRTTSDEGEHSSPRGSVMRTQDMGGMGSSSRGWRPENAMSETVSSELLRSAEQHKQSLASRSSLLNKVKYQGEPGSVSSSSSSSDFTAPGSLVHELPNGDTRYSTSSLLAEYTKPNAQIKAKNGKSKSNANDERDTDSKSKLKSSKSKAKAMARAKSLEDAATTMSSFLGGVIDDDDEDNIKLSDLLAVNGAKKKTKKILSTLSFVPSDDDDDMDSAAEGLVRAWDGNKSKSKSQNKKGSHSRGSLSDSDNSRSEDSDNSRADVDGGLRNDRGDLSGQHQHLGASSRAPKVASVRNTVARYKSRRMAAGDSIRLAAEEVARKHTRNNTNASAGGGGWGSSSSSAKRSSSHKSTTKNVMLVKRSAVQRASSTPRQMFQPVLAEPTIEAISSVVDSKKGNKRSRDGGGRRSITPVVAESSGVNAQAFRSKQRKQRGSAKEKTESVDDNSTNGAGKQQPKSNGLTSVFAKPAAVPKKKQQPKRKREYKVDPNATPTRRSRRVSTGSISTNAAAAAAAAASSTAKSDALFVTTEPEHKPAKSSSVVGPQQEPLKPLSPFAQSFATSFSMRKPGRQSRSCRKIGEFRSLSMLDPQKAAQVLEQSEELKDEWDKTLPKADEWAQTYPKPKSMVTKYVPVKLRQALLEQYGGRLTLPTGTNKRPQAVEKNKQGKAKVTSKSTAKPNKKAGNGHGGAGVKGHSSSATKPKGNGHGGKRVKGHGQGKRKR